MALTLLMVAGGAAAMLAVLGALAAVPGAQFIIALLLGVPFTVLIAWHTAAVLRTGELPRRFGVDLRKEQPIAYSLGVAVLVLSALGMMVLMGWCVARLLGA